jgi:hypothetical protein
MIANPPQRPALSRGADGAVMPAAPRVPERPAPPRETLHLPPSKGKKRKSGKDEAVVEFVVTVPKAVRKQLRKKAAAEGCTPEEAIARLVIVWLEG